MTIAALFVDSTGWYSGRDNVDIYDKKRNAKTYNGPFPVVAHPPCNLWINFAQINYIRYGGSRNKPGNDQGCFAHALYCVRNFCGVLEHPAYSKAWKTFELQRPKFGSWQKDSANGYVTEVWQSAYGHRARKKTWLYYIGINKPSNLSWKKIEGVYQCGWFDRNKPTIGKREALLTPLAFAETLIKIAENSIII